MRHLSISTDKVVRIPGTDVYVRHHYGANILINYEIKENREGDSAPAQQDAPDRRG